MVIGKNKHIKSISFNKKNENDNKILKHVARRNFSGYVKKLILADMEAKKQRKEIKQPTPAPTQEKKEAVVNKKVSYYDIEQQKQREQTTAPKIFKPTNSPKN